MQHQVNVSVPLCFPKYPNLSFTNMHDKIGEYRPFGQENHFRQKTASKWPKVLDNFWDIITLEGALRQIIDTRSTSGVPLKSSGHNHSNELCGRSVASKLTAHKPYEFFCGWTKKFTNLYQNYRWKHTTQCNFFRVFQLFKNIKNLKPRTSAFK